MSDRKFSRKTRTGLVGAIGHCRECSWNQESKNTLALAAQHHDRTGHEVSVEITRVVIYGGKDK